MPVTAKYPTTCAVCASAIKPGEQIEAVQRRWAHVACASADSLMDSSTDGSAFGGALFDVPQGAAAGRSTSAGAAASKTTSTGAAAGRSSSAGAGRTVARGAGRRPEPAPAPAREGVLEVWTDGACSGNPGPGGWAWATKDGRQASGGEPATTNQRMEIRAALEAVRALEGPLEVVSDSTYVVNCFRDGWWRGWLSRGWVNSAKKPVANRDLWEPLVIAVRDRGDVTFRWVKGHSGDPMNDLVDRLAVDAGRAVAR